MEGASKKLFLLPILAVIVSVFFAFPLFSEAAVNNEINYQGKLADSVGNAVADGAYNMHFRLCADSSCSSVLYDETFIGTDKVTVTDGLFSVMIGSVSSTLGNIDFNQDIYLEVSVGGTGAPSWETLLPRKQLGTVPNAFNTQRIEGLSTSSLAVLDRPNTFNATNTFADLLVNGRLGIGTTTPQEKLVVDNGSINVFNVISDGGFDYSNDFKSNSIVDSIFFPLIVGGYGYSTSTDYQEDGDYLTAGLFGKSNQIGVFGQGDYGGGYFIGSYEGVIGVSLDDGGIGGSFGNEGDNGKGLEVNANGDGGIGVDIDTYNADYGLRVNNSSTTAFSIYSTGGLNYFSNNVGVGTTTPINKFQVEGGNVAFGYGDTLTEYNLSAPTNATATTAYTGGYFPSNGYTHNYRIYSFKTVNGVKFYSPSYATATFTDDGSSGYYDVNVSWDAVIGVDGYRVFQQDTYTGANFDYYNDTTVNSFTNNDYYTYGNTVTPNTPYTDTNGTGFFYDAATKFVGVGTASPTQKLTVANGAIAASNQSYFFQTGYNYNDPLIFGDIATGAYASSSATNGVGQTGYGMIGVMGQGGTIGVVGVGSYLGVMAFSTDDSGSAGQFNALGDNSDGIRISNSGAGGTGAYINVSNADYGIYTNNGNSSGYNIYASGNSKNYIEGNVGIGIDSNNNALNVNGTIYNSYNFSSTTGGYGPFNFTTEFKTGSSFYDSLLDSDIVAATYNYVTSTDYAHDDDLFLIGSYSVGEGGAWNYGESFGSYNIGGLNGLSAIAFNDGGAGGQFEASGNNSVAISAYTNGINSIGAEISSSDGDALRVHTSSSTKYAIYSSAGLNYFYGPTTINDDLTITSGKGITLGGEYRTTWPIPVGGGSGSSYWVTSTDNLRGYPDLSGNYAIVIGAVVTSSNVRFEVAGNTKLGGELTVTGSSTFSGNVTISGNLALSGYLRDSFNATGTTGQILQSTGTSTKWVSTSTYGWLSAESDPIWLAASTSYFKLANSNTVTGTTTLATATASRFSVGTTSIASIFNIQAASGISALNITSSTGASLLTVTSAGNVGIGTATPGAKLEVNGTTRLATTSMTQLTIGSTTPANIFDIYPTSSNYAITYGFLAPQPNYFGSFKNQVGLRIIGGAVSGLTYSPSLMLRNSVNSVDWTILADVSSSDSLVFNTDGTDLMAITTAGNVGIGTTLPGTKFEVNGTSTLDNVVLSSKLFFRDNTTLDGLSPYYGIGVGDLDLGGGAAKATRFSDFYGLSLATYGEDRLAINTSGYVGIGTTAPNSILKVGNKVVDDNSYTYDTNSLIVTNQTPTSDVVLNDSKTVLLLDRQGTSGKAYGAAAAFNLSRYENSSINSRTRLDIALANTTYLNSSINVMTLLSNGNVGIGTTTPGSMLTIGSSTPFKVSSSGDISAIRGVTMSWPAAQGGVNSFLKNDGSGTLSWTAGTASPAGSEGEVQFNSSGSFSSSPNLFWDQTYDALRIAPTGGGSLYVDNINSGHIVVGSYNAVNSRISSGLDVGGGTGANVYMSNGGYKTGGSGVGGNAGNVYMVSGGDGDTVGDDGMVTIGQTGSSGKKNAKLIVMGSIGVNTSTPTLTHFVVVNDGGSWGAVNSSTGAWVNSSDVRLKKNVSDLIDPLQAVLGLRPVKFDWNWDSSNGDGKNIGFIAQEVEAILPSLVSDVGNGYKSLDYAGFAPILAGAIQAQQEQINLLTTRLGVTTSSDANANINLAVTDNDPQFNTLRVTSVATFYGTMTVIGEAGFTSKVVFKDHIYVSKDTAGFVKLLAGATSTEVIFSKPYDVAPVVNITPLSNPGTKTWWVEQIGVDKFVIAVSSPFEADFSFNWQALAVKDDSVPPPTETETVITDTDSSSSPEIIEPLPETTSTEPVITEPIVTPDPIVEPIVEPSIEPPPIVETPPVVEPAPVVPTESPVVE